VACLRRIRKSVGAGISGEDSRLCHLCQSIHRVRRSRKPIEETRAYRLFHDVFPAVAEQERGPSPSCLGNAAACPWGITGFWKCFVMSRTVIADGCSSRWSRLLDKRSKRS